MRCITFHILGTGVPSSLSNAYDPDSPARFTIYGPSQFGWNFPVDGSVVFLKTFLRTRSPGWKIWGFTRLLYRFASLQWYDAIHTAAASRSSFAMSRSLITDSVFDCSVISVRSVGILISVGTIASIP